MSHNNNNDHPIANDPPMEEGGAGVRVSSDDAANSSEYPESTEHGESPSHGSSDAGSKTGRERDHEGGGGVGGAADADLKPPANSKKHKTSDDPNGHSREANAREPTFPVKLHRILSNEHEGMSLYSFVRLEMKCPYIDNSSLSREPVNNQIGQLIDVCSLKTMLLVS
jgi:hypothetical protein